MLQSKAMPRLTGMFSAERRLAQVFVGYVISAMLCFASAAVLANTVYLVRHAEKHLHGDDPALTACGLARAAALADYLADVKLAAVYTTVYQRTQLTGGAVAGSKQLTLTPYDPRQSEQLVQQLQAQVQPVLVVGHSNTVPQLVTQLSGIAVAPLTEQDYDVLYRVELGPQPSVTLMRQQFSCDNAVAE